MQIIVLSMHRSGSSMVTRLINLMGAYFGPEGISTKISTDNLKGHWERKDIRQLNDDILHACHADWHYISALNLKRISNKARRQFLSRAGEIVMSMDAHRPWVAKEPRFCLLLPLWKQLLEVPVFVHVFRSPAQVAQSLLTRNGFPIPFGIALWECYIVASLRESNRCPRIVVHYQDFMADPLSATYKLYRGLTDMGIKGLHMPAEREILSFIDRNYWHAKGMGAAEMDMLTPFQKNLVEAFETNYAFKFCLPPDFNPETISTLRKYEEMIRLKKKYNIQLTGIEAYEDTTAALYLKILQQQHQKMQSLSE